MRAVSLVDLAPQSESVSVALPNGGTAEFSVSGLSGRDIAVLMRRFPAMREMMVRPPSFPELAALPDDASEEQRVQRALDIADLMAQPAATAIFEVIPAIIVMGIGYPDSERDKAERGASALPQESQFSLFNRIMALTADQTQNPTRAGVAVAGRSGKAPARKSRKRLKN